MRSLLGGDYMQNTVTKPEADGFDPERGQCCDLERFRVNLGGTTRNAWNKSATDVFVAGFLAAHAEYDAGNEAVKEMVQMKAQATLDSMIRKYRGLNIPRTPAESQELQRLRNRQERKRKVSVCVHSPLSHKF